MENSVEVLKSNFGIGESNLPLDVPWVQLNLKKEYVTCILIYICTCIDTHIDVMLPRGVISIYLCICAYVCMCMCVYLYT